MNIYLIRHPKIELKGNICYGQTELKPHISYKKDCQELLYRLEIDREKEVYTSPLSRCLLVAKYFKEHVIDLHYKVDERLMELNFGDWEMRDWAYINKQEFMEWEKDILNTKCPNGESYKELISRADEFMQELIKETYKGDGISKDKEGRKDKVIITHKGIILAILGKILGLSVKNSLKLEISNTSVTKLNKRANGFRIEYINCK